MTKPETYKLGHGLYVLHWTTAAGGGSSLAAVGSTCDGTRWYAPCNWTSTDNARPLVASTNWDDVDRAVLVSGSGFLTEAP